MLSRLTSKFKNNLGIDLGTTHTLIYEQDRGIVVNESSVVAVNTRTDQILAVGDEARKMLGKTPPHILADSPLESGVISNFEVAEKMLKYFIDRIQAEKFFFAGKPKVIIGIPLDVTEVERKAVEDVVMSAGARHVYLVESIMAAAIGARVPIQDPSGNMIVNLGGGLTEAAIISLDGIVNWKTTKIAGLSLDKDIISFANEEFSLVLGDMAAEEIKKKIGSVYTADEPMVMQMRGRDVVSGLPKEFDIASDQVRQALNKSVKSIIRIIKSTLETTPPELVADIYQKGIILSGGTSLLRGFDKIIAQAISIPVHIADDPQTCTVRGMGVILEDEALLKDIAVPSAQ